MFERLTYRAKNGLFALNKGGLPQSVQEALARLAAYEDIGLSPEEITDMIYRFEAFLCEMTGNRMSKSNYTLDAMISAANEYQQSLCDECWDRSELAKYYELEHEGRLVVLPVKVGDTMYNHEREPFKVYYISAMTGEAAPDIYVRIYATPKNEASASDDINFWHDDIGKTVFLTREEAEKAIGGETERRKEG